MLGFELAVGEDLNLGTGTVTVTNPGGGTLPGTQISISTLGLNGASTQVVTQAFNPGTISSGASVSATVTVNGALTSDFVLSSFDQMGANNLQISAFVQASNTVRVVLSNFTGSPVTPASGTLYILVLRPR